MLCLKQAGIEFRASHPGSFAYLHLPIYDLEEQDLLMHLPECFRFIEQGMNQGEMM